MENKDNKKKQEKIRNLTALAIFLALAIIPLASAYSLGIPSINLWDAFVEQTFGGFWMSIIVLCAVMFLILIMGSISIWTALTYIGVFVLTMAIGYGQAIVSIPLWVGVMSWSATQILQWLNTTSR